jgi:leucyl-tRNA synthetase
MEFTSYLGKVREADNVGRAAWDQAVETLLLMIAPAAPHIAEELWERTGHAYSVHQQAWPAANEDLARSETFTLVVQVNGKVRDKFDVPVDIADDDAKAMAMSSANVERQIAGKQVERVVYVPGRLVNIVVKG